MVYWFTNVDQRRKPSFQDFPYTTEPLLDFLQLMYMNASSSTYAKSMILYFNCPTNSITTLTSYSLVPICVLHSKFNLVHKFQFGELRPDSALILPSLFSPCHQDSKILHVLSKSILCKVADLLYKLPKLHPRNMLGVPRQIEKEARCGT